MAARFISLVVALCVSTNPITVHMSGLRSVPVPLTLPPLCRRRNIDYFTASPCTDYDFRMVSGDSALQLLRDCDAFIYVAAQLAARHVNQHRQGIFTYPWPSRPDNSLTMFTDRGTKVAS